MTQNVLQEAESLIFGDREATYGDPSESFNRIAGMWSAYLGTELDGQDVANLMILLKVSRTKGTYHRDSYVDIGGYAGLAERLHPTPITITDEVVPVEQAVTTPEGPRTWKFPADVPWGQGIVVLDSNGVEFKRDHDNKDFFVTPVTGPHRDPVVGPLVEVARPRQWQDLRAEVPIDVRVTDKDGDEWMYHRSKERWIVRLDGEWDEDVNDPEKYAPFTEVLGA